MPSVGSVSCATVKGVGADLSERVEIWQVPGIDGYGAQKFGKGEAECRFVATQYGALSASPKGSDVDAWYSALQVLKGGLITVTDDWGTVTTNFIIEKIALVKKEPRLGIVEGISIGSWGQVVIEGVKAN